MSTSLPPTAEEPLVYRPISGLAIAGFVIGVAYALVLVVAGYRALSSGQPLLLGGWWLALPLAAVVLSYLGQVHIRTSEGTRAGMKLTRWGLGLGLFFGLGYFVYSLGTGLAIRQQAYNFLTQEGEDSGFLSYLQKSGRSKEALEAAFMLTVSPAERSGMKAADFEKPGAEGMPGPLVMFRSEPIVVFFGCGAESEMGVEPLGVIEWSYGKEGFTVRRLFRISNEEKEADILLTVLSNEGREGETRRWKVSPKRGDMGFFAGKEVKLKPAGKVMEKLRLQALDFVGNWIGQRKKGEVWTGFADLDKSAWEQLIPAHTLRESFKRQIADAFEGRKPKDLQLAPDDGVYEKMTWDRDKGYLRVNILYRGDLRLDDKSAPMKYMVQFTVRTRENVPVLTDGLDLTWQLDEIRFRHAEEFVDKGPGKGMKGP